jgi:sporulation protein YhbH
MSSFTEHKTIADRSASDRRRHKQKIDQAIKEGIHNIVAEESIIGQDGKKKFKIPVKGIKEHRLIYGSNENNKKVGSAPGKDIQKGQKIGESQNNQKSPSNEPGTEPGTEYYDVEMDLDELAEYLFRDLELPELERKSLKKIMSERLKRQGYRREGIEPRLDKKKTAISRIKRLKAAKRRDDFDEDKRFMFHEDDLVYRHFKQSLRECSNAVIFFLMDISGSMTQEKKFLARSFYFLLYHFIRSKYQHTEIVFIAHDTAAYEVNEEQFFTRGESGGTMVSSALNLSLDVISKRYHPNSWNIYAFQCSDGDNWANDNEKTIQVMEKLKSISQLVGYCEICSSAAAWGGSTGVLSKVYLPLVDKKFKSVEIKKKADIWPAFKKLFGKSVSALAEN